jgi:hypothetical protein
MITSLERNPPEKNLLLHKIPQSGIDWGRKWVYVGVDLQRFFMTDKYICKLEPTQVLSFIL